MDHNAYRTALTRSSAGSERFFPPAEFTERRKRVADALVFRPDHCFLQVPSIETGPAMPPCWSSPGTPCPRLILWGDSKPLHPDSVRLHQHGRRLRTGRDGAPSRSD